MTKPSFDLLSRLWLREPDSDTLAVARQSETLAPHIGDPAELAATYTDLFLLNVYPYGTAFTDPSGELNGPSAWLTARRYEAYKYSPPELLEVGAPDHVGLCLGFLSHLAATGERDIEFSSSLLGWVPILCLAVEREPSAHPFYKALAAVTRQRLIEDIPESAPLESDPEGDEPQSGALEEEIHLSDIVRFFLAPARCGLFLSRSKLGQIARAAGMRLPFGSRFDVAKALFATAGESGRLGVVVESLASEAAAWKSAYRDWAAKRPAFTPYAARWLDRITETKRRLGEMLEILANPPEVVYADGWSGEG